MKQLATSIILIIIFAAIVAMAALTPTAQAMKRESALEPDLIIQPGDLFTALDASLQMGDGRRVDFSPFGLSWEA
jgi:hypothetical protein